MKIKKFTSIRKSLKLKTELIENDQFTLGCTANEKDHPHEFFIDTENHRIIFDRKETERIVTMFIEFLKK
jgi:hypothetical protein